MDEGSSPLARGAHGGCGDDSDSGGLIPARAGSTILRRMFSHAGGAHPRSRGEHRRQPCRSRSAPGSSPLARGAHPQRLCRDDTNGLIPARAGSTGRCGWWCLRFWAHPRSRGEHLPSHMRDDGQAGSSPLARGALVVGGGALGYVGLIPARAGSTRCNRRLPILTGAHPRSRGEHHLPSRTFSRARGSSPLARGAQDS